MNDAVEPDEPDREPHDSALIEDKRTPVVYAEYGRRELRRSKRITAGQHANPHHLPVPNDIATQAVGTLNGPHKFTFQDYEILRAIYLVVCRDARHSARKIVR